NVRFLAADLGPHNIRVNGISAGPIKTLAAAGIAGFRKMLGRVAEVAPLRRNVTLEDVGNAAAFLCSDLANGITGEITYVDAGFSTVGMSFPQEAGEDCAEAFTGTESTPVAPSRRATITAHTASANTLTAVRHMSRRRSNTSSTPTASPGRPTAARMTAMPTRDAWGMPAIPMDVIRARITTVNWVANDRCTP